MRLTDELGNTVGYLPLQLQAGEESAVIVFKAIPEELGERLRSSASPDAIVWGRLQDGGGAFEDLSIAPIDLDAYLSGYALVEIKISASAEIAGVRTVGQFLGVTTGGAAGWLD